MKAVAAISWVLAAAVGASVWGAPPVKTTPTYVIESSTMRLEVSGTYGYKVIEKATGNVLVSENQTVFSIGSTAYTASAISNVTIGTVGGVSTLQGTLALGKNVTAQVNFAFQSPDNLQVTLKSTSGTPVAISERFADAGERYYGVWENALPTNLDNRGVSAGYDGKEVLGTSTKDVFGSSARAPFYVTNKNYGVYTNTEAQGSYAFGVSGNTSMKFNAPTLQYNILHGTAPKDILAAHNAVAGPAYMPPDWAFSTIFWRDDFHQLPGQNPAITHAQQLVMDDAGKLQAAHIHAGAMWLDRPYGTGSATQDSNVAGWGNMDFDGSFPNASQMVQELQAGGINLMLWAANKANNTLKTEGAAKGYLFTGYSSSPAIDLRNGAAYQWLEGKLGQLDGAALLADGTTGIKGYKLDRGGEGEMPDAVINAETTLFQKLAYENMVAENGNDFFSFARNINGSGRQYAAVWSGDPKTTWLGFQTSIKNGIRSGLINMPMWGSDTGGYSGSAPSEELFQRWVAFSAMSPMMEIVQGPGRNIFYDFSPGALATTKKFTDLHQDLIPYTRSSLATALATGTPIMRALFLEFPNDVKAGDIGDEYLYGPNLLVAPVTTAGATGRSVYLPVQASGGRWLDYNNRRTVYAGGVTISAAAAVDVLPLYVREGAIVPRGDIVQGNNQWTAGWKPTLRVEMYPSSNFASSFDYYTGTGTVRLSARPVAGGLEVAGGDLGASGTLEIYLTMPSSVFLNGTTALALGTDYTYDSVNDLLTMALPTGAWTVDFNGSQSIFGLSGGVGSALAAVPEPGTLGLLGVMAGLLVVRRRR